MTSLCLALSVLAAEPVAGATYSGRDRATTVVAPRVEAEPTIDGVLDEDVWTRAAQLTGFSQYAPADGRPAEVDTTVAVWYSPTAIYFGIRAHAPAGSVRATLADRDKLTEDDTVQLFLSTFNDGRQALVFGVNPLGVQMDGALVEGTRSSGTGFSGLQLGREQTDLTPDYVFQSKGRLTAEGFEVEIRIPFKSLRYPSTEPQTWGLHVVRHSQATGYEDSWVPARREGSSFLSQAGQLQGLEDLRRGLVLDVNPIATMKVDGAAATGAGGGWTYDASRPEFGVNVRWGVTSNLVFNATVNPDFSQVESDAGQLSPDPRLAIYYPEKRPFFLDGIEQFATPNNLVYTRRIVAPVAAAKLTGKVRGTSVALLSALDDRSLSASGHRSPWFNIARVQRDIGGQSRMGVVYTDRLDSESADRVLGTDGRFVFRDLYTVSAQGALSRSTRRGVTTNAPLWDTSVSRNGRRFGFRYLFRGFDPAFRAASGFFSRVGIVQARASNQVAFFGGAGRAVEQFSSELAIDGIWDYDGFSRGADTLERKFHFNNNFTFRGGWRLGASVLAESFGFDRAAYRTYALARPREDGGFDVLPFIGVPRLPNLDYVISVTMPPRRGFSTTSFVIWGRDENFFEWASANILYGSFEAQWRPTEKGRVDVSYQVQAYHRRTDGSEVGSRHIPRLKLEYQVARPIFVRWVGEYDVERQDTLRDDSRTGWPILLRDATGAYRPATGFSRGRLRQDWLFSYQPTPGTVVFAGYGSTLASRNPLERAPLVRSADGFFLKASYLFRF
ncbi:MAG: DUF5916 domain-containing protein [Vicinamibacterales bacterium]